ncbi:NUDIX hydrolase [Dissulfurirhabdus thermomarina]|uniref:NUDIX hydrolase n=2 Tax=Dissulfurirhabdus thermomarina TaxID=1765737 RepID=A0A6N9TM25_DISTH|nr:NUDIX hydrolase [Dissulfurirhabdus thermomarina]NDY42169.1 NUDIX hydrolase [Dissulfurirhabdus thermomarina]NMX22401.1 NUDIX hydrolase [Dissulfurirhabdus thermomarina]
MSGARRVRCPRCGATVEVFRNPAPTVDVIIEVEGGIVFVERANPPLGWALPGGFVDVGETLEAAAIREAREETGLEVRLRYLLGTYSRPDRDPRRHTVSTVFVAGAAGAPRGGDDARRAVAAPADRPPGPLCFDHARIVADYLRVRRLGLAACLEQRGLDPP